MNGGWPQWKKQKTGQLCHQVMNWTLLPMTWCSVYVSGEGADIDIALLCHFTISLGSISLDFKSLNFISLDSISLKSISLNSITLDSIPLNSISFDSLSLYFHSLFYYTTLLTKLTRKLLLLDPLFSTSQHYLVRGVQNNRKFWVHTGFSKHRPSGRKKKSFFFWLCLTKLGGNHASWWIRDLRSKGMSLILAYI